MNLLKFVFSLALSFVPAVFGVRWAPTGGGSDWYAGLTHPILTPPSWFFSVVWTTLYFLLGMAFYLVIKHKHKSKEKILAIELFATHMILNAAWSYIFFGEHLIELGAIVIVALILVAFMMKQVFSKINMRAGKFIVPYIVWLFCALYLNSGIYILN